MKLRRVRWYYNDDLTTKYEIFSKHDLKTLQNNETGAFKLVLYYNVTILRISYHILKKLPYCI